MVKPVVVSVWIYKRFLLMLPPSPFVCNVATTFMAFVGKAIGNVTGLDKFSNRQIPIAIYLPFLSWLINISKPVFVILLMLPELCPSMTVGTAEKEMGNAQLYHSSSSLLAFPFLLPHCKERMIL